MQHGHQPELPEHHSRGADGSDRAARSRATSRRTTSTGIGTTISCRPVHVRPPSGRFEVRLQRQLEVQPVGDVRHAALPDAACRRCSATPPSGEPIGGSSNPGHGHGNTYRVTVMGTYIFSPTFLMDAHYGWARQGTAFRATRPRAELRARRAGHSGHERHACIRERLAHVRVRRRLRDDRRERELHAVLPARPAVAIRGELQLDQEASTTSGSAATSTTWR